MTEPGKFEDEMRAMKSLEYEEHAGDCVTASFERGARWAISESSVAKGLVEALEHYKRQGMFHPYDEAIVIEDWGQQAYKSLAEYRKAKGGGNG